MKDISGTMGSKGVERRKQATPGQTPEGNVVMSFSFESYQLEEEDCQVKGISDKGVLALSEPGESLLHMLCRSLNVKLSPESLFHIWLGKDEDSPWLER